MKKAVFLDRDGVINEMFYNQEHGLIGSPANPQQFKLKKGVDKFIKGVKKKGYLVIIVSNQPGIAKKKFTEKVFKNIRQKMQKELASCGVEFDAEYYCFHHPEAIDLKYKMVCSCRKPKPGLLLKAANNHDINLMQSWVIGDGINDIEAGRAASCKTILLADIKESEYLRLMEKHLGLVAPDFIVRGFEEALKIIP